MRNKIPPEPCHICKLPKFHLIEDITYNGPCCHCPETPEPPPAQAPLKEWIEKACGMRSDDFGHDCQALLVAESQVLQEMGDKFIAHIAAYERLERELAEWKAKAEKWNPPDFESRERALKYLYDHAEYVRDDSVRNRSTCQYFYAGPVCDIVGKLYDQLTQASAELAEALDLFANENKKLRDRGFELAKERAKSQALVEALKIIASHDYAGIAMADAHITLAREALKQFGE